MIIPKASLFRKVWHIRRPEPDAANWLARSTAIKAAKSPVIVPGGGVIYSEAEAELAAFAARHGIPVVETQGGKSALAHDHALNFGPVGVTGGAAANSVCATADLVIGVGTRFQDFTTGSWALFKNPDRKILSINVQPMTAYKHGALSLASDAKIALQAIDKTLGSQKWKAMEN
jgi:3D-(3,5/4)-trihydroxycyclohexane-1,2-dione acylhydrolase (decyclizing)